MPDNKDQIEVDTADETVVIDIPKARQGRETKRVTVKDLNSAKNPGTVESEEAETKSSKPRLESVVQNPARTKKPGFWRWAKETFTGEDAKSVARHVGMDIIIPAVKDLIVDAGTDALHRMIIGEPRSGGRSRSRRGPDGDRSHVPYGRMSTQKPQREISSRSRAVHDFEDIILDSRTEADSVLYTLEDRIRQYGSATVSDLYDLVDISGSFTDDKWGWFDMRDASVRRIRDGYILILPRPEVIE